MIKRKSAKGQVMSIEVAIAALLMVIFVILGFDIFIVVWGFTILDSAARDAARAAASTADTTPPYTTARTIATQACLAHKTDGYFVTQPTVSPSPTDFVYVTTGPNSPYATVTARCLVRVPIPINFFGAKVVNGQIPYSRSYTFPILGVPYTPTPLTGAVAPVIAPAAPPPAPVVTNPAPPTASTTKPLPRLLLPRLLLPRLLLPRLLLPRLRRQHRLPRPRLPRRAPPKAAPPTAAPPKAPRLPKLHLPRLRRQHRHLHLHLHHLHLLAR